MDSTVIALAIFSAVVFAASLMGTWAVLLLLRARAILDHPNERSSHEVPTPRGGGIAVIAVILVGWMTIGVAFDSAPAMLAITAAAAGLAWLSWWDDVANVSAVWRLAGHGAAVAVVFFVVPPGAVFQGLLSPALDLAAAAVLWVWFINLFNFMDGIDGLAGVETVCIGGGLLAVSVAADMGGPFALFGLVAAAAALGFLRWNWAPARIFLGDVGSVPLGFLLGWLLLSLAATGQWAAALILPLYYLADSTLTLIRRGLRRAPVWKAHREHFYQRAVARGSSHGAVAGAVLAVNAGLVALAGLAASGRPAEALAGAGLVVVALLLFLAVGPVFGGGGARSS